MKRTVNIVVGLALLGAAFFGGYAVRTARTAFASASGRPILYWVDPMHPAYKSDRPGIAPDCGMDLVPVYGDPGGARVSQDGPRAGLAPEGLPASAIRIPAERQQLIGVKYATVEWDESGRSLRTVGTVTFDERRVAHVHPRFEGWIEKVLVDFTGEVVAAGQPMLTIYSPEMLASQQELLLAARARDLMAGNPLAEATRHGESLFEAARRRLELWDLSADQIEQVLTTGKTIRSVSIRAPMGGVVLERSAFPNQRVTPDSDLYTIADLSRVWIMADVFESDMTSISIGSPAYLMFPYEGTRPLGAKVTYVQPQVDATTRTLKVRLEAANPGLRLKPEMFVNVEFGIPGQKRLVVPADSVLNTGDRRTVFVDLGDGFLEPRPVEVGPAIGDRVAIVSGLAAGERIVASGTFLVDSESRMQAALGAMGRPSAGPPSTAQKPDGHVHD